MNEPKFCVRMAVWQFTYSFWNRIFYINTAAVNPDGFTAATLS